MVRADCFSGFFGGFEWKNYKAENMLFFNITMCSICFYSIVSLRESQIDVLGNFHRLQQAYEI